MTEDDENFVSCATCIHCMPKKYLFGLIKEYNNAKCRLAVTGSLYRDRVTGKEIDQRRYETCSSARLWTERDHGCGPDGNLWSPIDKKDMFKQIKRAGYSPTYDNLNPQVKASPPKAPNGPPKRTIIEGVSLTATETRNNDGL